jgi:hypothetical protein
MRNTDPINNRGWTQMLGKSTHFSLLRDTRHGTHIVMYDTSMQNKANSTNKIYYLLQPTRGKDEPNIVGMQKS